MEPFEVKGVRIGDGRPRTIVSLMASDPDALVVDAKRAVAAGADCVEWRADFFAGEAQELPRTARLLVSSLPTTPIVLTLRSVGQGGRCALPAAAAARLVHDILSEAEVDLVDVEACWGDELVRATAAAAHERGVRAIVSDHVLSGTPTTAWMVDRLARMASLGADLPKLAVTARDRVDCLRLMEATAAASAILDVPLVTMAMGAQGALSRLAGEACGSALTFCALDRASAPGQVELSVARRALDALHEALPSAERHASSTTDVGEACGLRGSRA